MNSLSSLLSIALLTLACIPTIARVGIEAIHIETIQLILFGLGYASMLFQPYRKIKTYVKNCVFEGYSASSSLIRCLYLLGQYERSTMTLMYNVLSKNSIMVDIGANEGYFTVLMAKVCKKVIAIEPASKNVSILKNNVSINNLKNVVIHQVAAGSKNGNIVLNECVINGMWNCVGKPKVPLIYNSTNVPVRRVYELLKPADIPLIKLIKIDVEEFEFETIQGMLELLSVDHIIWIVETCDYRVCRLFKQNGFLAYYLPAVSVSFPQIKHQPKPLTNTPLSMQNCIFSKTPIMY